MMKKILALLPILFCLGCSSKIDEHYAKELVEHELSLSGDLSAHRLGGGLSGSSVFLVTNDSNKYVVKFFKNKRAGEREIYNSCVASDCGYGPKVYFSDRSKGELICEYLSGRKISMQDLQSNELYTELAHLLQMIHCGEKFQGTYDVFRRINHTLQNNREECKSHIPMQKIEETVGAIQQALAHHICAAPCHNDLYGGNIVFAESGCRAIDYGDAGQNDPYYDMATVADYFPSETKETFFLTTYLGRAPSSIEKAKLCLMKQVVLVKWMCDRLDNLTAEQMQQYDKIKPLPKGEFFKVCFEGKLDLSKTEWVIQDLKVFLNEFLTNSSSIEFSQAITLLMESRCDGNRVSE
jgi:thiamine kinase-like enzyme